MTLAVVIRNEVGVFVIADIVWSQDQNGQRPAIEFPNAPSVNISSSRKIVGIAQKIFVLAKGLLLCCAGADSLIDSLIHVLKDEYRRTQDAEATGSCMQEYLNNNREKFLLGKLGKLEACLVYSQGKSQVITHAGCLAASTDFLGDLWILGSGTKDFCQYADTQSPHDYPSPISLATVPDSADRMGYVLDYVVQMLKRQEFLGHGVADAFGGGFEIAFSKKGYIEKIDNIFLGSYEYYFDLQGKLMINQVGGPIFQFYIDEQFIIVTQSTEGKARPFHVPPLTASSDILDVGLEERRAQLLFVSFYHRQTRKRDYHLGYNEAGFEGFGLQRNIATGHYAINFDKRFIAQAIRRLNSKPD